MTQKDEGGAKRRRPTRSARKLTTVLSTRLPIDLVESLDKEAEARGIYTSELIRETLESRYLKSNASTLFK